ncbi:MAG: hypothetical protein KAW92_10360 [Candidatus Cloacimonetes bacterium]|nr:hypothetical protein [Candidatus Cloacimonadota bacterium]
METCDEFMFFGILTGIFPYTSSSEPIKTPHRLRYHTTQKGDLVGMFIPPQTAYYFSKYHMQQQLPLGCKVFEPEKILEKEIEAYKIIKKINRLEDKNTTKAQEEIDSILEENYSKNKPKDPNDRLGLILFYYQFLIIRNDFYYGREITLPNDYKYEIKANFDKEKNILEQIIKVPFEKLETLILNCDPDSVNTFNELKKIQFNELKKAVLRTTQIKAPALTRYYSAFKKRSEEPSFSESLITKSGKKIKHIELTFSIPHKKDEREIKIIGNYDPEIDTDGENLKKDLVRVLQNLDGTHLKVFFVLFEISRENNNDIWIYKEHEDTILDRLEYKRVGKYHSHRFENKQAVKRYINTLSKIYIRWKVTEEFSKIFGYQDVPKNPLIILSKTIKSNNNKEIISLSLRFNDFYWQVFKHGAICLLPKKIFSINIPDAYFKIVAYVKNQIAIEYYHKKGTLEKDIDLLFNEAGIYLKPRSKKYKLELVDFMENEAVENGFWKMAKYDIISNKIKIVEMDLIKDYYDSKKFSKKK